MSLLTVTEVRDFIETPLEDAAIQLLLDGLEQEIVRYAGASGSVTDLAGGGGPYVTLDRPASAITSITETVGSTVTTLAADDYLVHPGGLVIERLNTGTNPRWRWWGRITVVSTASDDDEIRKGVQLDLFRLAESYAPGVTSEQIGSWMEQRASNSAWNASSERAAILARLDSGPSLVVVGGRW